MRSGDKIVRVRVTEIGPIVRIRRTTNHYRIVKFRDLDDDSTYTLCVLNGHKNASRFLKLPVGTRISGVVIYTDKGKHYVDGNSNYKLIEAKPLF